METLIFLYHKIIINLPFLFNNYSTSEMNALPSEIPICTSMQDFNNMLTSLRHVFKYLNIQDLLSASRVCTAWNVIAMYNGLVSIILYVNIV